MNITHFKQVSQNIKNTRPMRALSTEMWWNCTQIWKVDQEKYKPFPKFHCNPVWSCSGKSVENTWGEIWKSVRTNTNFSFPKFHCQSNTLSNFEDVFRHFVMNFSEQTMLHINLTIRGRANQSFPASLAPNKSLYFASTFSASLWEGLPQPSQYLSAQPNHPQIRRRQSCLPLPPSFLHS